MKPQRTLNPNAGVFGVKAGTELSGTVKSRTLKKKKKKVIFKAGSELSGTVK